MREQLHAARNQKAVSRLVREYVNAIPGAQLARLPVPCQALLLRAHLGVEAAAVALVREELRFGGGGEARALLREVTAALVAAANRLVQIEAHTPPA